MRYWNQKGIEKVVHQYKNNGYNIVLDVNSGSVHVVDDIVYDLTGIVEGLLEKGCIAEGGELERRMDENGLTGGLPYAKEEIREALEEILELKEAGMLYAPDIDENYIGDFKRRETVDLSGMQICEPTRPY